MVYGNIICDLQYCGTRIRTCSSGRLWSALVICVRLLGLLSKPRGLTDGEGLISATLIFILPQSEDIRDKRSIFFGLYFYTDQVARVVLGGRLAYHRVVVSVRSGPPVFVHLSKEAVGEKNTSGSGGGKGEVWRGAASRVATRVGCGRILTSKLCALKYCRSLLTNSGMVVGRVPHCEPHLNIERADEPNVMFIFEGFPRSNDACWWYLPL